jgi:hypothetical protein
MLVNTGVSGTLELATGKGLALKGGAAASGLPEHAGSKRRRGGHLKAASDVRNPNGLVKLVHHSHSPALLHVGLRAFFCSFA